MSRSPLNVGCCFSEECYVAVDHCARSLLEVCASDTAAKHTLLLTLLENHDGRTLEMVSFYGHEENRP
jgi:hypothetical protein